MVSLVIFSVVPPTEPCALRLTHPLKVSTRDFSWGKGGRCVWLTTYHPCSVEPSRKSGALIYPEPLGPLRPVVGDLYFTLFVVYACISPHDLPQYTSKDDTEDVRKCFPNVFSSSLYLIPDVTSSVTSCLCSHNITLLTRFVCDSVSDVLRILMNKHTTPYLT